MFLGLNRKSILYQTRSANEWTFYKYIWQFLFKYLSKGGEDYWVSKKEL